jgi:hypothetical protein
MDICDIADDLIQQNVDIARVEASRYKKLTPTGLCLNCDQSIDTGLFCDAKDSDCRDQHARREAAQIRAGAH